MVWGNAVHFAGAEIVLQPPSGATFQVLPDPSHICPPELLKPGAFTSQGSDDIAHLTNLWLPFTTPHKGSQIQPFNY